MAEDLLQSIKQISRERGINPDIFFSAIKEALLTVSKKYFDPNASIQIEIDEHKGIIEVYVSKLVVKEVSDPPGRDPLEGRPEIRLQGARRRRHQDPPPRRDPGTHRRPVGQADHHAEDPQGRAGEHLRKVFPAGRHPDDRRDPPHRERQHHPGTGVGRSLLPPRSFPPRTASGAARSSNSSSSASFPRARGRWSWPRAT